MKVLDLLCAQQHAFEGWFASEDAFQQQLQAGQVECPFCGNTQVAKQLSAPRLNLGAAAPSEPKQDLVAMPPASLQAAWLKMARYVLANTEDVGPRFAEEARRIHYGESGERGIRGQASPEDAKALAEEGIDVLPLPLPKGLKEPLH